MRLTRINLQILLARMASLDYPSAFFGDCSASGPGTWYFGKGIPARWNLICLASLPDSLVMTNYILATHIDAFTSMGIYLKEPGRGIIA